MACLPQRARLKIVLFRQSSGVCSGDPVRITGLAPNSQTLSKLKRLSV